MINLRRLKAVARKEFLHVLRDWRSLVLAIFIPVALILLFGYALNMDLNNTPTLVWDQSRTPQSREFVSLLEGSPYFRLLRYVDSYREIEAALDRGEAMLGLAIPGDFAARTLSGREAVVQALIDGSDSTRARLAMAYIEGIGRLYDRNLFVRHLERKGRRPPEAPVEMEWRAWYNPDLRSANSIIPGIIALVMVVIAAMLTSVTIAREWEMGTMEQLIGTPVEVPELLFGKVAPYFAIGLADVGLAVALGQWLFAVPLRGSAGLLFALASVFLAGMLFFGLMLSASLKSQVLANQAAILSGYLPTLMLSGFVFAFEDMPTLIRALTYIVPARYFIEILRGIYLKGIGWEVLWLNASLLGLYALAMIALAHKKMKLKLE